MFAPQEKRKATIIIDDDRCTCGFWYLFHVKYARYLLSTVFSVFRKSKVTRGCDVQNFVSLAATEASGGEWVRNPVAFQNIANCQGGKCSALTLFLRRAANCRHVKLDLLPFQGIFSNSDSIDMLAGLCCLLTLVPTVSAVAYSIFPSSEYTCRLSYLIPSTQQ